jgi:hypothetical protein
VDVEGVPAGGSGAFTAPISPPASQATFVVRRVPDGQPTHVNLVVEDGCGDWSTFVGGGPGAF